MPINEEHKLPHLIDCSNFVDDRGVLTFSNEFNFEKLGIKRFYQVENHKQDYIRAWHGHNKEAKYVYAVSGSALVAAVNMETDKVYKFTLSNRKAQILYIPPGYANGFKTLTQDTILMFFSTSTAAESQGDDIRYEWDKWDVWGENYR